MSVYRSNASFRVCEMCKCTFTAGTYSTAATHREIIHVYNEDITSYVVMLQTDVESLVP